MRAAVRLAWGAAGLFWFLWLGYEDATLHAVVLLAAGVCLAASLTWASRRVGSRDGDGTACLRATSLIGLSAGVLVSPVAVLLIFIKVSLHTHAIPDFSFFDVALVLARAPVWALAGLLLGAAGGMLCLRARSPQ